MILNADDFKVVDRIELAKPDLPGMEQIGFGGLLDSIGEPRQHISLFNSGDPYVHNRVFGIARFDLFEPARELYAGRPGALRHGWTPGNSGPEACLYGGLQQRERKQTVRILGL
jgi:hypothetical protein